ncbi:hypothetical protein Q8A73_006956 [Channa argus]|nr:hypothetical protein Q8A73_006956 [Channa argus]
MGALGVSRDQIWGSAEIGDTTHTPLSPLKKHLVPEHESTQWQQCDTVVSRVSRLLQTLKLSIFPLESEHELAPSHTANLKQDLAALQQENEKEQKTCWREVMKLRDQLQQVYQERHDAHTEVQKRKRQVEVEKLQQLHTSSNVKTNRAKGWDAAKGDKKRPAHSLEQAVLTNCREQYQAISLRPTSCSDLRCLSWRICCPIRRLVAEGSAEAAQLSKSECAVTTEGKGRASGIWKSRMTTRIQMIEVNSKQLSISWEADIETSSAGPHHYGTEA